VLVASGVGAQIDLPLVPVAPALAALLPGAGRELALACALAGGDDYELCFTAPPAARAALARLATELGLPLTRIGSIVGGGGLVVRAADGAPLPQLPRAFDHFPETAP
jgi:thiamine-monophosphate kinase